MTERNKLNGLIEKWKRIAHTQKLLDYHECADELEEALMEVPYSPERIFIAGPYCPYGASEHDASRLAQRNVDKALEIGNALIDMGHYIFVPHVSHYIHTHYSNKTDKGSWWYDEDNTFLDHWATALYFIGSSRGADKELERAKNLGLNIYYSLDEVPILDGEKYV